LANPLVVELVSPLPPTLREKVATYAESIEDATPSIAADQGIEISATLRDRFAVVMAIRYIYRLLETQESLISNSVYQVSRYQVTAFRSGNRVFAKDGDEWAEVRRLREELQALLATENADYLTLDGAPGDILKSFIESSRENGL
jgi:hypothetical protein